MIANDRLLRVCRGQKPDRTPIWIMRQAGRYLPEYRELRREHSMQDCCLQPDLVYTITRMPLERFDLDAAILFSDLTIPYISLGAGYELREGVGPVVAHPVRCATDVATLRTGRVDATLGSVAEAINRLSMELTVPIIGFAGAPFTLASYLVEGRPSRDFVQTRRLMLADPDTWHALMQVLTATIEEWLSLQIRAGVTVVQLFDSWVGALPIDTYRSMVLPYVRQTIDAVHALQIPVILFGTACWHIWPALLEAGADVLGVDWRVSLSQAAEQGRYGVQGNLDPAALLADVETQDRMVDALAGQAPRGRHIFNLGHGILPDTAPERVSRLIAQVHAW